jgi:hypothetical protein
MLNLYHLINKFLLPALLWGVDLSISAIVVLCFPLFTGPDGKRLQDKPQHSDFINFRMGAIVETEPNKLIFSGE